MIIIEIQYSKDGTIGIDKWAEKDRDEAEALYHSKLSVAAKSSVYMHSVVMLNERGDRVKGETYYHEAIES